MADNNSVSLPAISVRGTIKLGQFLKLANLVEDGAEARVLIQSGDVTVNGEVETRRGSALSPGDIVQVNLPTGTAGAQVSRLISGARKVICAFLGSAGRVGFLAGRLNRIRDLPANYHPAARL